MNILILSEWGGGVGLALRFQQEGHKCKIWISDPTYATNGDGLVEKTKSYKTELGWADLIVSDDSGQGAICDKLRKQGHTVWGGTANTDLWESERGCGQDILKKVGMETLPSKTFKTVDEAIKFVQSTPGLYVVKPDGSAQENKALTYVGQSEDGSDVVAVLENCKNFGVKSLELQKKVDGVEVAVSGYFDGTNFMNPIEVSFEHKKLLNDDLGPNTGEMGTTMFWTSKQAKLYKETIDKCVPLLREERYVGYFDINCIEKDGHLYPLEFTCRFGYPTNNMNNETIAGNLGDWYYRMAKGQGTDFKVTNPVSCVVCLSIAPFPYEDEKLWEKTGKDTLVLLPKDKTGVWPLGIRQDKGQYYQALQDGSVVNCTGQGKTIEEALKMAYNRIKSVIVPDPIYRTDIGHKWKSDLQTLHKDGWL